MGAWFGRLNRLYESIPQRPSTWFHQIQSIVASEIRLMCSTNERHGLALVSPRPMCVYKGTVRCVKCAAVYNKREYDVCVCLWDSYRNKIDSTHVSGHNNLISRKKSKIFIPHLCPTLFPISAFVTNITRVCDLSGGGEGV